MSMDWIDAAGIVFFLIFGTVILVRPDLIYGSSHEQVRSRWLGGLMLFLGALNLVRHSGLI